MRIGIMGGTFDPIHLGHLIAAESSRESMELDEIWFMPCNDPPHKQNISGGTPAQRLRMVENAIRGNPHFRVSELELNRGGVSYSVETVEQLLKIHPDYSFYYIIGADMIEYLPKWHRVEQILEMISFIGLKRPGYTVNWNLLPINVQDKVTMVAMPPVHISSTEIRQLRANGKSIRYLVPDAVLQWIEESGLYGL